jgi:hypothetical protein
VVKVFASQPRGLGFELYFGQDHRFSYDISNGCSKEADSKVVFISCKTFFAIKLKYVFDEGMQDEEDIYLLDEKLISNSSIL